MNGRFQASVWLVTALSPGMAGDQRNHHSTENTNYGRHNDRFHCISPRFAAHQLGEPIVKRPRAGLERAWSVTRPVPSSELAPRGFAGAPGD